MIKPSKPLKCCVIGRGWIGNTVYNELKKRGHTTTIISHTDPIPTRINWIINCAGYTGKPNVDACEQNKHQTILANVYYPVQLYERCQHLGVKMAHFSSGCIYQGTIDSVNAEPNFFGSTYSTSKGMSDTYLKDKCLLLRIRMPFTERSHSRNLLTKLINYNNTSKLYDGGENSLTDLDEAITIACNLIENDNTGPFNLVNQGSINNHELIKMLASQLTTHPRWYTNNEFAAVTTAGRSTCVIPCNTGMRDVKIALAERIAKYHYV